MSSLRQNDGRLPLVILQHLLGEMLFLTNILVRKHEVVTAIALRSSVGLVVQNLNDEKSAGLEVLGLIARNFRRYFSHPSPTRVQISD
jgi:hypothetical protein